MSVETRTWDGALLILGTRKDAHVHRVIEDLERKGQFRVYVLDYLADTRVSLYVDTGGVSSVWIDGERVPENLVLWDRVKIGPGSPVDALGDDDETVAYVGQEWRALFILLSGIHGDRSINPLKSKRCLLKPFQQMTAAAAGFLVPNTLVTNNRNSAIQFHASVDEHVIIKPLSDGMVTPLGGERKKTFHIMTMRVTQDDLKTAAESELAACPHFFQEEIRKAFELRVVVVGEIVLAFRIDSQKLKSAKVDWRKGVNPRTGKYNLEFTPYEMDAVMIAKIKDFMKRSNLFTGSLDLIVDENGRAWFLECNQDGAWGWLDDIVEGRISRAFARAFTRMLLSGIERRGVSGLPSVLVPDEADIDTSTR